MGDKSLSVHLYSGVFKALKFLSPEKGTKLADFVIKEIVKENVYFRTVFLAGFAEGLVLSNRKKAKEILDLAIKDHGFLSGQLGLDVSIRIAKTLFKLDPIQAEKMLDDAVLLLNSNNENYKNDVKANIAVAFIEMNLQKGIDLANDIKEIDKSGEDLSTDLKMSCLLEICCSKLAPSFSAKLTEDEIWEL